MNEHLWTVVLAGGESKRFEGIKALAAWRHGTLLSNAIEIAQKFSESNVLVVTGGNHETISQNLSDTSQVHNKNWQNGMGSSIACGVEEITRLDNKAKAILVLSIDQPLITQQHLNNMLQRCHETGLCVLSTDGSIDGPPAIISPTYFNIAKNLTDEGLKKSLDKYERVENIDALSDADTKEELVVLAIANL